jgi:hypothetical protein
MTQRFPFEVPLQLEEYSYARPVDERSYNMSHSASFIDGDNLHTCMFETQSLATMDERVKACLDSVASADEKKEETVFAIWTKRRLDSEDTLFFGAVGSTEQGKRIDQFFDKHVILVLGRSPAPAVTTCMLSLFGNCHNGGIKPVSQLCQGHRARMLGNTNSYPKLDMNQTFFGYMGHNQVMDLTAHFMGFGDNFAREPGF